MSPISPISTITPGVNYNNIDYNFYIFIPHMLVFNWFSGKSEKTCNPPKPKYTEF
jgi:hypothetical protein